MANPAEKLVEAFGGSRASVAAAFAVSSETIRLWLVNGIPTDRALEVEEKTRTKKQKVSATEVLKYARAQKAAA